MSHVVPMCSRCGVEVARDELVLGGQGEPACERCARLEEVWTVAWVAWIARS